MCICSVDEHDGLAQSLQQNELLVQDKQAAISQLDGQTAALQSEISAFKQNKDDVSLLHTFSVLTGQQVLNQLYSVDHFNAIVNICNTIHCYSLQ